MLAIEISPDVAALVDVLRATSPGQTVTYATLSSAIGRDVTQHRHLVASAQRIAGREHGAVFANERNVGYTRLATEQLPSLAATARAHIRRASRTASKRLRQGISRANDVAPQVQRKINAEISSLALLEHIASDKAAEPNPNHDERPEPVAVTARRLFGLS